jgi:quercetin dioxygenase-like cupin family protein
MTESHIFSWSDFDAEHIPNIKCRTRVVTGENMQLIWAEFAPDGKYAMHSHPHEQFSFMLQGRLRLTVGEEEREIGPGDMWHAPANVPHGGVVLGDEPVIFIDVYSPVSDAMTQNMARLRAARLGT